MLNPELEHEVFGCKQMPNDAQCRTCKFIDYFRSGKRWPESSSCEKYPPKRSKPEPIRFEGALCEFYEKEDS